MPEYIAYLYARMQKLSERGGVKWETAKAEYSRAVAWWSRHA